MLNVLACITVVENEKGELGVGLDLQLNEETLKKLQELLPKLAEDISNMSIDDIDRVMGGNQNKNFILEQEIKDKVESIDVDEYIKESLSLPRIEYIKKEDKEDEYMESLRENIISELGVPLELLEGKYKYARKYNRRGTK